MTQIRKWSTIICRTWKVLQIRYRWKLQSCTRVKRTATIISRTTWLTSIQRCCTPSITRLTRTRSLEAISSVFIYLARVSSPMRMSIFRSSQRRFEPFKDMFSDETMNHSSVGMFHLPFDSKSAFCENKSIRRWKPVGLCIIEIKLWVDEKREMEYILITVIHWIITSTIHSISI